MNQLVIYENLEEEVEVVRQSMVLAGLEFGLNHHYTIELSTELDRLLNELFFHTNTCNS
ncbi:aspartyl-phosphate phosphatase Spo0E family protein [Halalkalibacter alkaliphilus]|uniref:Aspartyl-phosphate phosphatase Spo0E family protein n=1 Tax=Halalkalibacter alkaliphilus TaxID=2917993 RepID=A0A9X1ZW93_9BACI|nr:aspartyl-phosphate phosphatase Spo0E family protein [Halalkalibacter alkaliphilus]MCL7746679.1 aspartyl-phosphate phosphatase Spo0E family protein [Halalkalibacter alkaliphilus]